MSSYSGSSNSRGSSPDGRGERPSLPPIQSVLGYYPPRPETSSRSNRVSTDVASRPSTSSRDYPQRGSISGWSASQTRMEDRGSYPPSRSDHPSLALPPSSSSPALLPSQNSRATVSGGQSQYAFDNFQPTATGIQRIPASGDAHQSRPSDSSAPTRLVRWVPPVSNPTEESRSGGRGIPIEDDPLDETRRYVCTYCPRRFSRPSSLQTHLHTHTGETPYMCTYPGCGKSFNVASNMRRHMRNHEEQATVQAGHSFR